MDTVESKCDELRQMRHRHLEVGTLFLGSEGTVLHFVDMLAIAVLDRSLSLCRAFINLVEDENIVAASIICRCQLDNGLRFFATTLTDEPADLVKHILTGSPLHRFKDRTGTKMTDSYLKSELAKYVSWVPRLYEQASGYVHLSDQHLHNSVGKVDEAGTMPIKIDGCDGERWTEQARCETVHSFCSATRLLLEVVEMWGTSDLRKSEGGGQPFC